MRRQAFAGELSKYIVSTSASYSALYIKTADPRLDTISISVGSRLTRSMRWASSRRASLAVTASAASWL